MIRWALQWVCYRWDINWCILWSVDWMRSGRPSLQKQQCSCSFHWPLNPGVCWLAVYGTTPEENAKKPSLFRRTYNEMPLERDRGVDGYTQLAGTFKKLGRHQWQQQRILLATMTSNLAWCISSAHLFWIQRWAQGKMTLSTNHCRLCACSQWCSPSAGEKWR